MIIYYYICKINQYIRYNLFEFMYKYKTMNNNLQHEISGLENYLKINLSWEDYENLHVKLGLSKKMLTLLLRDPKKLPCEVLMDLAAIAGKPINEFSDFLK